MLNLSKNENKYRKKLMSERHYNRKQQKIIDCCVLKNIKNTTYKELYIAHKLKKPHIIFLILCMDCLKQSFKSVEETIKNISFSKLKKYKDK